MPHFATKDLSALNTEAAGHTLSNASYAASNATKKGGFLTAAPGGKKQITARGEGLVDGVPRSRRCRCRPGLDAGQTSTAQFEEDDSEEEDIVETAARSDYVCNADER